MMASKYPKRNKSRTGSTSLSASSQPIQDGGQNSRANRNQTTQSSTVGDSDNLICKFCNLEFKEQDDKLTECERCEKWVCITCSRLPEDIYSVICKEQSILHWYCSDCNAEAMSAVKTSQLIETKCQQYIGALRTEFEKKFQKLEGDLEKVNTKCDEFVLEQSDVNKTLEDKVDHCIDSAATKSMNELQERESRKLNIVFFNVPECNDVSPENRKLSDTAFIHNLATEILPAEDQMSFDNVIRLGKIINNKPRPVRATLPNIQSKNKLLRATKRLKESGSFNGIGIRPDLTPLERDVRKDLLSERLRKEEESLAKGESKKWVIRRGKIVNVQRLTKMAEYITDDILQEYEENGVVCLRGVFDDKWLKLAEAGIKKNLANPSQYSECLKGEGGPGSYFNDYCNWQKIEEFEKYVKESPAAAIVGKLMKTQEVVFYHDHVLTKDPGTAKVTPWHHDQSYYPIDGNKVCSIWMPIDPVSIETSIQYVRGSHKWNRWFHPRKFATSLNYEKTGKYSEDRCYENIPDIDNEVAETDILKWEMQPGDCIVFHMLSVHGAPPNTSLTTPRRVLSTRWLGDDAVMATRPWDVSPPITGGLTPGNRVLCDTFPLVWKAS